MLLVNANVITIDPARPRAEAVLTDGERIAAVGSTAELRERAPHERPIDLAGATVIPGFNEAHCHLLEAGKLNLDVVCTPDAAPDIPAIVRRFAQRAAATPPDRWICGNQYDVAKLAENRHPTRQELDAASTAHPILLWHVCSHVAVANSMALQVLGYTRNTPDPVGGRIGRDPATGELTGRLDETAIISGAPNPKAGPPPDGDEVNRDAVASIADTCLRLGITSGTDVNLTPDGWGHFLAARAAGRLPIRVRCMLGARFIGQYDRLPDGDEWAKVIGFKVFSDGAIAGRTACLTAPYEGTDDRGVLAIEPEEMNRLVAAGHRIGAQVGIHANGDRAIALALDAIEAAMAAAPRPDPRHRLEHGTVMTAELIERTRRLGVVVAPFSSYVWHHGEKMSSYGRRIEMMFAHRSLLAAGVHVAGSSDHPCAPLAPLLGIHSCVNRVSHTGEPLGTNQRITPEQAIGIYTAGSAYATFEENTKGRLRPGMLADLAVLAADPTAVDPMTIKDIAVKMTIVGGRIAWAAEGFRL